jgi:hypothetical protein
MSNMEEKLRFRRWGKERRRKVGRETLNESSKSMVENITSRFAQAKEGPWEMEVKVDELQHSNANKEKNKQA